MAPRVLIGPAENNAQIDDYRPDFEVDHASRIEPGFVDLAGRCATLMNPEFYLNPGSTPAIPEPTTTIANDATSRRGSGPPP